MGWGEALAALGQGLTNLPKQLDQLEQLKLNKQLAPLQLAQAEQQLAAAVQQQELAKRAAEVGEAKIAAEGIGFDRPIAENDPIYQAIAKTPYKTSFEATGGLMPGKSMQFDAAGGIVPGDPAVGNALGKETLTQGPAQMLKRPSFNESELIKQNENARRAAEAQQKIAQGLARIQQGDVRNDQGQQRINISQANADSLALYRDALKAGLQAGQSNAAPRYNNQVQWVMGPDGKEVLMPVGDILAGDFTRAPTADMRNRLVARQQALPVMNKIKELSARINTNQGILATVKGGVELQKARVNLNNDVAQYVSIVNMFTPLLARSVGHVGVLTEQDVQSVKAGLPQATDSQELALAKLSNVQGIMDQVNSALSNDANYGMAGGPQATVPAPAGGSAPPQSQGAPRRRRFNPATGQLEDVPPGL